MRPASAVIEAINSGHSNVHDIATATGLREPMVASILEFFKANGTLSADTPQGGCATGKGRCSSCQVANSCGSKQLLSLGIPSVAH